MRNKLFYQLILVTHRQKTPTETYLNFVVACAKSGITCVQLREKNLSYEALLEFGRQLQPILKPFSIPLIVNDNIKLAFELDADGVHLGQSDGDVCKARQQLGKHKKIGLTINSIEQIYEANLLPLDYVGIGAIFPTKNKANVQTIFGCDGLKKISSLSKHPVVAIGGIDENNALAVMQSGARGIAAIGAFHETKDPILTTKNLQKILERKSHV
ncbi:MAG: thiamine phosphate synthase [Bdellovibrionota bacterium]